MGAHIPADIRELQDALAAAERDAEALVAGLTEEEGAWRIKAGSWSVAECLDHLATGNRMYLGAMQDPADRARAQGRFRRRPASPGWAGRLFVYQLEPPPKWWSRLKAPRPIRPRTAPPLAETFASFTASQTDVREFLRVNAYFDLAGIRFRTPSYQASVSALPPVSTSSRPTRDAICGRRGASAGRWSAPTNDIAGEPAAATARTAIHYRILSDPEAAHAKTMVGKRIAHYEVLDELGAGGMGVGYRARDTRLDREVAIKTLPDDFAQDPERLARLEREAKVLASVNHANIAGIHGLEKVEDRQFLILELVEGETLEQRISRGPISVEACL